MAMRRTGLTHGRTIRSPNHSRSKTDRYGRMRRNETVRTSSRASNQLRSHIMEELAT